MNEPFLLSNLIDLQDIDNEITKLITKKSEGKTVLELKKLEQKYKEVTKAIAISKEAKNRFGFIIYLASDCQDEKFSSY